jgi:hypothetical protein
MGKARKRGGLTFAALAVCASAASADDLPPRKPGLWEVTTKTNDDAPTVSRLCLDAAVEAKLTQSFKAIAKTYCTQSEGRLEGAVFTYDSVCPLPGSKVKTHTVTTFAGEGEYRSETRGRYDPPYKGKTNNMSVQSGKWLGPCPADMKPGDRITDGVKSSIGG